MATIPSLAMIPSGYKAGKVYSVLPADGSGDFTFTRVGALPSYNATRVNENGLIEEVLSNVPRLDYSNGGCPSLLLEPERRNLALYSEDFSNGVYSETNGTVIPNSVIAPDGTLTADTWTATANSATLQGVVTVSSGVQYTMSIYLKRKTGTGQVALRGVSNTSTNITITDEWQRYSVTLTSSDVNGRYGVLLLTSGDEVYVWGAQLEQGSYPTSYIPTTSATVTRVAETCSEGGDINTFNDSEGVLYLEASALSNGANLMTISINDGTSSNHISLLYRNVANEVWMQTSGGGSNTNIFLYDVQQNINNKIALSYSSNLIKIFINGILKGSTSISALPTGLNSVEFNNGGQVEPFYGNCKDLRVYKTALSDAELQTLTTL